MSDPSIWNPGSTIGLIREAVAQLTGISTSSVTIGSGTKVFVTGTFKLFIPGNWVMIVDAANINNYMLGQIVSYDIGSGLLTVNVPSTAFAGSGTKAAWTITVSGVQGVNGQLVGDVAGDINFLGNVNVQQTLDVVGAATFAAATSVTLAPTAATHVANKAYVNSDGLPIGAIVDFARANVIYPDYLECNGQAVSRASYPDLFAYLETVYGAGDGITTFNVPNLNRRVTVGRGGTGTGVLGNGVANVGGSETHTLTIAEMPSHSHKAGKVGGATVAAGGNPINITAPDGFAYDTSWTGSSAAHNNIQPSMVVLKAIKAKHL